MTFEGRPVGDCRISLVSDQRLIIEGRPTRFSAATDGPAASSAPTNSGHHWRSSPTPAVDGLLRLAGPISASIGGAHDDVNKSRRRPA